MTDLNAIMDRIAIGEVKARYCRALDGKDWDAYADCFTEDVELDTRPAGGPLMRGRDEVVRMVSQSLEDAVTAHQVHSPEITLDGDSAQVIWAMQDRVVWNPDRQKEPGLTGLTGYGHYHERYVRCADGQWRIAAQVLTRLHVDRHYEVHV